MIPVIGLNVLRPLMRILDLIPTADSAFRAISDGTARTPSFVLHPNDQADIHIKAASLLNCPIFTVKMAGWSQALIDKGEPSSSGMIAVFDSVTCQPLAILQDNHLISDFRTAAAGARVAQLLAPAAAKTALVIGTGIQARLQVEGLLLVRPIQDVEIWGRNPTKTQSLVQELCLKFPQCKFRAASELSTAVNKADVIITVTGAKEPVFQAEWLRAGQHITSIGSDDATKCEIDPEVLTKSQVYVDSIQSALLYGSVGRAVANGQLQSDSLIEIGTRLDVSTNAHQGVSTIACLTGLGIQDLTAVRSFWPALASH
jgi:ornithine cyclodeaminase/alanine dehydrogenase-like protein (mu-crystallin family)